MARNLDLRCVLISDPSILGAGAKTRLESRIKRFTPHCVCRPAVQDAAGWRIDKLGTMINPLDANLSVGADGTHCTPSTDGRAGATCGVHLHAVDSGAFYSGTEGKLGLLSLDSMLVSVGEPLPSPGPYVTPNPLGGVHFSLVDNTWNTNYPEWYPFIEASHATTFPGGEGDENTRFRFVMSIS